MSIEAEAAPEESIERDDGPTLGSRLRAARESRELPIEKIADELRIEEHVLVALEEDRLDDIKVAPVFIKGYIKQYGRLLELDYDELRRAFYRQIDTEDVRLRPNSSIQLRDERQITMWIIAALAVLLVGIALFVWWLGTDDISVTTLLGESSAPSETATLAPQDGPATRPAAAVPARAVQDAEEIAAASPQPGADTSRADTPGPAAPGGAAPGEQPAPGGGAVTASAESGAPSQSADPPAGEPASAVIAPAPPAVPEPGSVPMVFEFAAESWFELDDANGRRLYYDLAGAGRRLNFMALPPARVLIGNAAAVSITVDSQAYTIPAGSLRGNVASFVIDPAQD